MEQLVIILLIALISIINWIVQKSKEAREQRKQENRQQRMAERADPRPQITVPEHDAPWLPHVRTVCDVLANVSRAEPPVRNVERRCSRLRTRVIPKLHLLNTQTNNPDC